MAVTSVAMRQFATPVIRPLPSRLRIAFMAFLLLEELDLVTTLIGRAGVVEGNVVIAAVLGVGGGFAFLLVKMLGSAIVYWSLSHLANLSRISAHLVLVAASVLMLVVVVNNLILVLA